MEIFIDIHVHPNFWEPICKTQESFRLSQEALNIHKNSISPMQHVFHQMDVAGLDCLCILAQDERSVYTRPVVSNDEVAALRDANKPRFFAFASVDPKVPNAVFELRRCFDELKLDGLSLNCSKLKIDPLDTRLIDFYETCLDEDKPILFHCGCSYENNTLSEYTHPLKFERIAATYPNLRIGLEHFGWPWVKETAMLMLKYPNVYVDTGALYFDSALEFYSYIFNHEYQLTWVERSLRHQIMFGSDNPRFEQIRMAKALDKLGLSSSTLELIKGQNAIDFLGVDDNVRSH